MASLGAAALDVLGTGAATDKAAAAREMARLWRAGGLAVDFPEPPPDRPARPEQPQLLAPRDMPRRRGRGVATRVALLHAVAHIELNAIDLAADMVARFGPGMPRAFLDDWIAVADDEARHFLLLADRLAAHGAAYGDLPAHDGLWQSAAATAHDLATRLAVVPMVLEARGLDVTPAMIARLDSAGDSESADALRLILDEEVAHVAAGRHWFDWLCERRGLDGAATFHHLVSTHYRGIVKPPFNDAARARAGLDSAYYRPLAPAPDKRA